MRSEMIVNYFISSSVLLCILHFSSTDSKRPDSGSSFRRKREATRPEYSEYPDYDHHPRKIDWENLPEKPVSQIFSETPIKQSSKEQPNPSNARFQLVPDWPNPSKVLGQLSAVSIDANGNVVVFHRGDRVWSAQTFSSDNKYQERHLGPIQQNTIVVFNITTGLVIEEWGSDLFYLPHGLTVDAENNVWVTDVALHQVFKFPAGRSKGTPAKAALMLGTAFIPGNDDNHFCKPTDVAVLSNGDFFVSDGYCNARIVKYDKSGRKLLEWGRSTLSVPGGRAIGEKPPPDHFLVPHGLAVAQDRQTLFVADRENGRVQCFNTTSGVFITQLHADVMGPRLFSVAYAPVDGGLLYIVNGPVLNTEVKLRNLFGGVATSREVTVGGFVASLTSHKFVAYFNSNGQGLQNPHDVAVTKDGSQVFVVELQPFKVWKFVKGNLNISTLVPPINTMNTNASNNVTKSLQSPANLKLSTEPGKQEKAATAEQSEPATGSVTAAIVIIVSMVLLIIVVVAVVIARIRRGRSMNEYTGIDMNYYED